MCCYDYYFNCICCNVILLSKKKGISIYFESTGITNDHFAIVGLPISYINNIDSNFSGNILIEIDRFTTVLTKKMNENKHYILFEVENGEVKNIRYYYGTEETNTFVYPITKRRWNNFVGNGGYNPREYFNKCYIKCLQ